MANAAQKKLAAQNKHILTFMLAADLIVNVLFWILRFFVRSGLSKFSKFVYAFASISSGFLHYQLHRAAAPKYDARGSLLYVGQDLLQEGVTSYMVDYMYFSWILIFLAALTSVKVFAFYLLVPIFVVYKAAPLLKMLLQQLKNFKNQALNQPPQQQQQQQQQQHQQHATPSEPVLSKRQQKLRKKAAKYSRP
ncbi:SRP-independent ER targeting protein Snd2 [Schizosaccharomyces pombe]|uniref:SRP-independent targeting protein 2 homolog n=1 Tax=Schizosaccharomyces pombe (strain 972 / ATCC 24843) TaxID=284812 RepID=MUG69_SCHPO|nr:putative ENV10 family protein [Schizosaccharomyces pombe]O14193.4 RecName: Full=SRP-independent targeting protein 2 homolog; AltName: Full=Meiotically up-regulated gene 69 protein [Schizosaccharomyces pombe 972h-]CAB16396.2 ENV10 family protein (predicted) [Schizosaccharomyces pombe]|eukprot:NP_593272.1 putative ENV10 family protein [Schizosaccharomyces pombe]